MATTSNAKNASGKPLSLVWLRRDLRLYDHAAFAAALASGGLLQPVFVFDSDILARFCNPDDRRLSFIAEALCDMHESLRGKGGGVLVLHGRARDCLPALAQALAADNVFACADFEPDTRKRDLSVAETLKRQGVAFTRVKDHLICAPHEVLKDDGSPYKVFTPYAKAWLEKTLDGGAFAEHKVDGLQERCADFAASLAAARLAGLAAIDPAQGAAAMLQAVGYRRQELPLWPVKNPRKRLHDFIDSHINAYKTQRDMLGEHGTSRLSPYLRFGLISVRECARLALFHGGGGENAGAATWLKELVWREFYAMILFHFPTTPDEEFQENTRGLQWRRDEAAFQRFAAGMTGYPVVDAAMRELLATGYMHNRARMIVASFLTKDLLLDWRMGEEHFAQHLMDYELASNVGGWQWGASTGTDAQPYFRIFNPLLQSRKFDPEGKYIRAYVPELAHLGADAIHEPGPARPAGYPAPIVEHALVKGQVMAMFKKGDDTRA